MLLVFAGKSRWAQWQSLVWLRGEQVTSPMSSPCALDLCRHAALHCPGYVALIGSDDQSWGLNLVENSLLHNGKRLGCYPRTSNAPKFTMGESLTMIVDRETNNVYFEQDGQFLGVAFSNLPPVRLYPAICAVYGNTEVSMSYSIPQCG